MFSQRYCEEGPFCVGGSLYVADFNADAMDDIYCHAADGSTEVAEATIRSPRVRTLRFQQLLICDYGSGYMENVADSKLNLAVKEIVIVS